MAEALGSPEVIGPIGNNPITNMQQRFARLPQKNKMGILIGIPLLIAVLASLLMWANQTSYRVLFSGLNDQDGGAIVEALTQMKVPYEFNTAGTSILVPSNKVYDTRLALASQGLPKGSVSGFEAMDNQKLGITQFQEQVNYQRALEGELIRSIQSISAVQSARVHLAIPKPSIFIREKQTPSASIVLNLFGSRTLSEPQINGIVHLVASSLPSMNPEDVSIVDQSGRLLTGKNQLESGLNPTQLAYTNQIEQSLTSRIVDILTPVFGSENVRATVTANMDYSTSERTDEIYKPNGDTTQATIRSQQMSESNDGTSSNPQGVPGVMANTPPGEAAANIGQNPQQALANGANNAPAQTNNSNRKDSTVNYEVDKSVQYTKSQVGKIERLSAAVVVNFKTITDPKGETRQVPLTPEEITQLDNLVKQAIGFDEQRGDAVNVVNQAFTKVEESTIPMWAQQETMDLAKSLGMPIGIALVAAILVFGIFRPMMKPAEVDLFNEGPELLPGQRTPLLANKVGGESDVELLEQLQREGTLPGMNRQQKLEKLRELAREHPQIVANIVKNWVNGETQNA
ncbi:MAG: flagellar M-ring protein FliF [Gammaproteobacteria bacterium]|uniref:flagellar basal-body MS-ring/collar protein FliF n=1 Tax=Limnobacter sp. TaxID=2003368 RepID=UPI001D2C9426|nr:flagellar basal-body MS-ring/collar protein FliF [Limnobacter sp.]MBU0784914.1 flagellar M-ring protein FliF [Gammaproteobacteria bacterium]MBU0848330.1 flagellar M-ring protein FliF [Gammaproteobacteria bacterium]MBU1267023.1 flagellar M-ring protein FliF [Gammaproteobacteria bacterium]MBU1529536.1 flagellar M-ring protein FliF [Gammaproteobacteria bacterium]MBU1781117.1 flagellar M-ring protein FliF [Gammaproteobacteria bacterium]